MRMLTAAAGAVFLILAASPALAGGPTGGGHPGGGRPGCGSGCGGGGHAGGSRNINVNVNANASASASAYAGASARSYLNARSYTVGGARGAVGGGTVYVGGGYGGDAGGFYGVPIYNEAVYEGRACAPAPFGYVLGGFGRDERHAPVCGSRYYEDGDRGGRYGYSERRESREESRYEESRYESYEEYGSFEARADYRDAGYGRRDGRHEERRDDHIIGAREYDRGYMDGRRDCDCRPDGRDGEPWVPAPEPAPYGYAPEPPPAPVYEAPMTPNQYYGIGGEAPPPRQRYSQEPGERG